MTVAERKAAVERDLQQAQQQAQVWMQRMLVLQGKLEALIEVEGDGMAVATGETLDGTGGEP